MVEAFINPQLMSFIGLTDTGTTAIDCAMTSFDARDSYVADMALSSHSPSLFAVPNVCKDPGLSTEEEFTIAMRQIDKALSNFKTATFPESAEPITSVHFALAACAKSQECSYKRQNALRYFTDHDLTSATMLAQKNSPNNDPEPIAHVQQNEEEPEYKRPLR